MSYETMLAGLVGGFASAVFTDILQWWNARKQRASQRKLLTADVGLMDELLAWRAADDERRDGSGPESNARMNSLIVEAVELRKRNEDRRNGVKPG